MPFSFSQTVRRRRPLLFEPFEPRLPLAGDVVWLDVNNDGLQTQGEPGLPDAVVDLMDPVDGVIGNGNDVSVGVRVTDALGRYAFANPAAGTYYLQFRTPIGYTF